MKEYVADTHALYWYLIGSSRLTPAALAAFKEAEQGQAIVIVSSVVMAELYYLLIKQGVGGQFPLLYQQVATSGFVRFADFKADDVLLFDQTAAVPEMHDRIIAGIAYRRGVPCLTRDPAISNSGLVTTIW